MIQINIESFLKFISDNHLKNTDGNILFNAEVKFYTGNSFHSIVSQVQVIILPHEIAVYILEFLKEVYQVTEMYSTANYHFTFPDPGKIEIRQKHSDPLFVVSITVLS